MDKTVSASGAVVYWKSGDLVATKIEAALDGIGLARFAPQPRTPAAALKVSLLRYCESLKPLNKGKDYVVQSHKSGKGYDVLEVERGDSKNDYYASFGIKVEGDVLSSTHGYPSSMYEITQVFKDELSTIPPSGASSSLVKIVKHLGGLTLRESGGIYHVPGGKLDTWRLVRQAFKAAADTRGSGVEVYCLTTSYDEDSLRAIHDALDAEVKSEIERIKAEPSESAQDSIRKISHCDKLKEKVERYEAIIGHSLTTMSGAIEAAKSETIMAAL